MFMTCKLFEVLMEGNRGGGKTDALIMDFVQHVGPKKFKGHKAGYGKAWRGVLFRRTYPELEDVLAKVQKWLPRMFPDGRFISSPNPAFHFATGEVLLFRQLHRDADYFKFHGHEYPWIGFEELTTWPLDTLYKRMMSCCRSSHPDMPRKIRATTNPSGAGHNWVKKRFRLPVLPGRTVGRVIHNPGEKPRVAIRSDLHENKKMLASDPDYQQQVIMAAKSHAERLAWTKGDWNIIAGGMFDDVWDHDVHVVPSFPGGAIPIGWRIDRAYDHGSTKPFSVGWYAESNGEPLVWEGRKIGIIPGDLIRFGEWYGSPDHSNTGLRLTSSQIAEGIIDREQDLRIYGRVRPGPADHNIFSSEPGHATIHSDFLRFGVKFLPAAKGPNSRILGWELMRQRFLASKVPTNGFREDPGLFICDRCIDALEKLPTLQRDKDKEDDVDTESEDHIGDEVRYRVRRSAPSSSQGNF